MRSSSSPAAGGGSRARPWGPARGTRACPARRRGCRAAACPPRRSGAVGSRAPVAGWWTRRARYPPPCGSGTVGSRAPVAGAGQGGPAAPSSLPGRGVFPRGRPAPAAAGPPAVGVGPGDKGVRRRRRGCRAAACSPRGHPVPSVAGPRPRGSAKGTRACPAVPSSLPGRGVFPPRPIRETQQRAAASAGRAPARLRYRRLSSRPTIVRAKSDRSVRCSRTTDAMISRSRFWYW